MDDDSLEVILRLQLEDLEHLEANKKGKQRQGETPDFDVALSLYRAGVEEALRRHRDRTMGASIVRAVVSDAPAIQACSSEERQAESDRAMAVALDRDGHKASGRLSTRAGTADEDMTEPLDDELFHALARLNVDGAEADEKGESSAWAASRKPGRGKDGQDVETEACVICGDEHALSSLAKAPCSHSYCGACLNLLFQTATVDESLFPLRCCRVPIPLGQVVQLLSIKTVVEFKAKQVEFGTANRTYCHHPACSTFVPPPSIKGNVGTCVKCGAKTCVHCKAAQHGADNCPRDSALQEVLRVAKDNGWQQCKSCNRIVELKTGCYHMNASFTSVLASH